MRVRPQLTDDGILERILDGSIEVDIETAEVKSRGKLLKVYERTSLNVNGSDKTFGTYRFVHICKDQSRKKIALHRIVWIAATRQLTPEGFVVDHVFDNDDDTIGNCCLMIRRTNDKLGGLKRGDLATSNDETPF